MNWKKGATSIEADGIAEGFKKSIELHGVKFNKLIGNNIKYKYLSLPSINIFNVFCNA